MSVCLITGAAGGIGGLVARQLADRGFRLHLTDRPGSALEGVARDCPGAAFSFCDLTRPDEIEALFEQLAEPPQVVFNAIGKGVMGKFDAIPAASFSESFELNFFSPLFVNLRAFRTWKTRALTGRLLTVSSVSGHRAYPSSIAYGAAKHALEASMTILRKVGEPLGIAVGTICPTNVDTGFWSNAEVYGVEVPDRSRMISPEQVAHACVEWIEQADPPRRVFVPEQQVSICTRYGIPSPAVDQRLAHTLTEAGHQMPPSPGVALITGASSGLGLALSRALSQLGWTIVGLARNRTRLEGMLRSKGGPLDRAFECDVCDPKGVKTVIEQATAAYGSFDLLVNNAGSTKIGWLDSFPNQDIRRIFETNFYGYLHPTRASINQLIDRRGTLLNVLSITAQNPAPVSLPYSCAKAAQAALSDALRHDLAASGVRVIDVFPGNTKTEFFAKAESVDGKPVVQPANAMDPEHVVDGIVELLLHPERSTATINSA